MKLDPVQTAARLVAIPSVNPMGGDPAGPDMLESRLTEHLAGLFDELGLPHVRQAVAPGRENIFARLDGSLPPEDGGALVLFDAHQDTVPVGDTSGDPWSPAVRQGRLFGRGSCDTKGAMAAMLSAITRLAEDRPHAMPTVVLSCPVDEEHGFTGAAALARLWTKGPPDGALRAFFPRRPDVAIVGEPTGLDVVVAHKGAVRWKCVARGRAGHSSDPGSGENAIYRMARVVTLLERYQAEAIQGVPQHPLCGGATLSVGTIRGGLSVNTIPDTCAIEIDRRVPPGESLDQAYRHVLDYVEDRGRFGATVEHEVPTVRLPSLVDTDNGALGHRLAEVVGAVVGGCRLVGQPYGTHAAVYAAAGVPSVVFGPGFSRQAHTREEWVPVEHLTQAAEVFYRFAREGWAVRHG